MDVVFLDATQPIATGERVGSIDWQAEASDRADERRVSKSTERKTRLDAVEGAGRWWEGREVRRGQRTSERGLYI